MTREQIRGAAEWLRQREEEQAEGLEGGKAERPEGTGVTKGTEATGGGAE